MLWYTASSAKNSTSSFGAAPLPNARQNSRMRAVASLVMRPTLYPERVRPARRPSCADGSDEIRSGHGGRTPGRGRGRVSRTHRRGVELPGRAPRRPRHGDDRARDGRRAGPPRPVAAQRHDGVRGAGDGRSGRYRRARAPAGPVDLPGQCDHAHARRRRRPHDARGVRRARATASSSPTRGRPWSRRRTSARRSATRCPRRPTSPKTCT